MILSFYDVQNEVCQYFGVRRTTLLGRSRKQGVVWPRSIAMFLARKVLHMTLEDVGVAFQRHHTTVSVAIDRVIVRMAHDSLFLQEVRKLEDKLLAKPPQRASQLSLPYC